MANIDDINLFHKLNVEREIIPNKYQLLINNNNCKHYNKPNLKSIGNLPRNHEDQYIFYNYDKKYLYLKHDDCLKFLQKL